MGGVSSGVSCVEHFRSGTEGGALFRQQSPARHSGGCTDHAFAGRRQSPQLALHITSLHQPRQQALGTTR
jgi:hypothetical protein